MYWAKRGFASNDYEPYVQRLHQLLVEYPWLYREFIMVSCAASTPNRADYYVGLPNIAFLAVFDGFEIVPESALPKAIDTIHLADTTTGEFNSRFRFKSLRRQVPNEYPRQIR